MECRGERGFDVAFRTMVMNISPKDKYKNTFQLRLFLWYFLDASLKKIAMAFCRVFKKYKQAGKINWAIHQWTSKMFNKLFEFEIVRGK